MGRAPGLVPFHLQVHKHHVILVAKRIHRDRGVVLTIERKGLGANLRIQGRVKLILG